ncbi:hypothetical protein GA0070624_3804 [Micromonospora rhizosphaerae]|uniref:Uncharacterized protein n=1 Tax=Micromonospora rhizosphaerae TaxID=568872 RepID=A0A1C6SHV6_9ACTN|nr:hypothetical protein GA0070624_3804 [Micromonospora rhizosphaerae]
MTVYVSRNAANSESRTRDSDTGRAQLERRPPDPPLLTYVWRQLFERQAGRGTST